MTYAAWYLTERQPQAFKSIVHYRLFQTTSPVWHYPITSPVTRCGTFMTGPSTGPWASGSSGDRTPLLPPAPSGWGASGARWGAAARQTWRPRRSRGLLAHKGTGGTDSRAWRRSWRAGTCSGPPSTGGAGGPTRRGHQPVQGRVQVHVDPAVDHLHVLRSAVDSLHHFDWSMRCDRFNKKALVCDVGRHI